MKFRRKPVKQYRRKRFWYRFRMVDSPRSARLLGFGILLFAVVFLLSPVLLGAVLALSVPLAMTLDFGTRQGWMLLIYLGVALQCVSCSWLGVPYQGNRHRQPREWLTAGFWRRNWSSLLGVLGVVPWIWLGGVTGWLALIACGVLAVVFAPDSRRIRPVAWIPLLLFVLCLISISLTTRELHKGIARQGKVAQIAFRAEVSWSDLVAHEASGLSVEDEPLKSLFEQKLPDTSRPRQWLFQEPAQAQEALELFRQEHSEFFAAMEEFLALPVRHLGSRMMAEQIWQGKVEHGLDAIRDMANVQTWQMHGANGDREVIRQCNANLQRLREWCVRSRLQYDYLAAISVEHRRIQALVCTLPQVAWTREEFAELLTREPDWQDYWELSYRHYLGHQCALCGCLLGDPNEMLARCLPAMDMEESNRKLMLAMTRQLSPFLELYLALDHRNILAISEKTAKISLRDDLTYAERLRQMEALTVPMFYHKPFQVNRSYRSFVRIQDEYDMAWVAFEVMEKYRATELLPEDLSFLPTIPCDRLGEMPFSYEAGHLHYEMTEQDFFGFRLGIMVDGKSRWCLLLPL